MPKFFIGNYEVHLHYKIYDTTYIFLRSKNKKLGRSYSFYRN